MAPRKKAADAATAATLTERIEIPLDAKEVAALGLELADKRLEHTSLKNEKHEKDKSYNEKLNVLDDAIQELAQAVKDHVKFETIEVDHRVDDKNFEIKIHRKDNGKHIRTRPMDQKEREAADNRKQLSLGFGGGAPKGKARKAGAEISSDEVRAERAAAAASGESVDHKGQTLRKTNANKGKKKK